MSAFEASSVTRRRLLGGAGATTMLLTAPSIVRAQEQGVVKIGLIQSMTGPFSTIGKAVVDGARLYMQQHGDAVAGRKIQLIVKDDATSPEIAKRLAQEMIVNDKVAIIGVGITPSALTIAPLVTEAYLGPDTLFAVFPGNQAGIFAKQFLERGMDKSGIRLIGADDLTDDDELPGMTDALLGIVTASHYSALHDSPLNKTYVKDFEAAYRRRPNFISLGGYDGMHLIYEALKKTGGKTDGDAILAAMKSMKWESPRGPMSIDPETRDVVHNEYIRKVEKVNGQLYNVEFATVETVKDPVRGARK
jgi:branched-chain amino acid transport system substrate-binding protein